jgi:hypothetical protein
LEFPQTNLDGTFGFLEWSFSDEEDSWCPTRVGQGSRVSTIEDAVREATGRVGWLASALGPSMRRPVSVKRFISFLFLLLYFFFFQMVPMSQAASVATLPSALLVERWSLGASWVYSIQ